MVSHSIFAIDEELSNSLSNSPEVITGNGYGTEVWGCKYIRLSSTES